MFSLYWLTMAFKIGFFVGGVARIFSPSAFQAEKGKRFSEFFSWIKNLFMSLLMIAIGLMADPIFEGISKIYKFIFG